MTTPSDLPYGHPAWVSGFLISLGELQKEEREIEYRLNLGIQKQQQQEYDAPSQATIEELAIRLNEIRTEIREVRRTYHPEHPGKKPEPQRQSLESEFAELIRSLNH